MDIIKQMTELGNQHGVFLTVHPMSGWGCRITTFEHDCGVSSNHETWCDGQCTSVSGAKSPEQAFNASVSMMRGRFYEQPT